MSEDKFVEYPKYVDHPTQKNAAGHPHRVIVNNPMEESQLLGKKEKKETKKAEGWSE